MKKKLKFNKLCIEQCKICLYIYIQLLFLKVFNNNFHHKLLLKYKGLMSLKIEY